MTASKITLSPCHLVTLSRRSRGFTLVEVLAAITVIAIVLPTVMYGLSLATNAASLAKHRTQATTLAQTKLDELLVDYNINGQLTGASGDFGDQWPGYTWTAAINAYDSGTIDGLTSSLTELDVTVSWRERNDTRQATLATLLYQSPTTAPSSGLGGSLP